VRLPVSPGRHRCRGRRAADRPQAVRRWGHRHAQHPLL